MEFIIESVHFSKAENFVGFYVFFSMCIRKPLCVPLVEEGRGLWLCECKSSQKIIKIR
jgi:hypothetical protein